MENLENGLWTKEEDHSTPMFCRNSCTADFTFHMFMFILPYSFYLHSTQTPSPSTCCISAHSDTPGNIADIFVTSVSVIRSALRPCLVLVLLLGRDSNICTQPQQPAPTQNTRQQGDTSLKYTQRAAWTWTWPGLIHRLAWIRDAVIPWWSERPRPPQHRSLQIRDLSAPAHPISPPPVKKFYFQIERRAAAVCRQW